MSYQNATLDCFRNDQGKLVIQIDPLGASKGGGGDFIVTPQDEEKLLKFLQATRTPWNSTHSERRGV